MGHYLKDFKFYVTIMTIFCEKGGIVFKEGHYVREDIIQGNTVSFLLRNVHNRLGWRRLIFPILGPPPRVPLSTHFIYMKSKFPLWDAGMPLPPPQSQRRLLMVHTRLIIGLFLYIVRLLKYISAVYIVRPKTSSYFSFYCTTMRQSNINTYPCKLGY